MVRACFQILSAVLTFFSWSLQVGAYPTPVDFDGKLQRWNIRSGDAAISIEVVTEGLDDAAFYGKIVEDATELWNSVSGSYFRYVVQENADGQADVTVTFQRQIDGGDYAAGYSLFDKMGDDGPVHCDVKIADDLAVASYSLRKTTLHELGHCLGLGHSLVPQSIMSYSLTENDFALAIDDEAAVARLYPEGEDSAELPPGCSLHVTKAQRHHYPYRVMMALLWLIPAFLPVIILPRFLARS